MKKFWFLALSLVLLTGCNSEKHPLLNLEYPLEINLLEQEGRGGHTLERHVAKSDEYLINRLLEDEKLNRVSTFSSIKMAEASINAVLNLQRKEVANWWKSDLARQAFFYRVPTHGRYITREMLEKFAETSETKPIPDNAVVRVVLLRKDKDFIVLTAFPEPDKQ